MSRCKGCNAEIVWAVTQEGKRIPLDVSAPVYVVCESVPSGSCLPVALRSPSETYVSHFATCPKATLFSASGKGRKRAMDELF